MAALTHADTSPELVRSRARRRADDIRLAGRHRGGDLRARELLIQRYLPLARRLAHRYAGGLEPIDDLVQVASLGLVKAVDRWDPERGLAFSSFAVPTILGELRRHFRDATWMVRPPRGILELSRSVERAREPIAAVSGPETVAELAARLGRSPVAVAEALQACEGRTVRSLDSPVHERDDEPVMLADTIGGEDPGYAQAEAGATIDRLTPILDDRAREILRLRFQEDLRQADIAERVGCSQMHVSRTIRASLKRLEAYAAVERAA